MIIEYSNHYIKEAHIDMWFENLNMYGRLVIKSKFLPYSFVVVLCALVMKRTNINVSTKKKTLMYNASTHQQLHKQNSQTQKSKSIGENKKESTTLPHLFCWKYFL